MKELLHDEAFVVLFLIIAFFCGGALGFGMGRQQGFDEGFDKALPLTYASVNK